VAITRDNILGSNSGNGSAAVTITTGAIAAAGSRICVAVSWFSSAGTMAVSDGTAYTKHTQVDNGNDHIAIFSRVLVGQLNSGSSITGTITGGAGIGGLLLGAVSYIGTTAFDTPSSNTTSGASWQSGSATNTVADALFFGGAGNETSTSTSSTAVNGSEVVDVWNTTAGQGLAVNETIAASIASRNVSGSWVGASSTATTGVLAIFSGTASTGGPAPMTFNAIPFMQGVI
jgi:hypothetical protein